MFTIRDFRLLDETEHAIKVRYVLHRDMRAHDVWFPRSVVELTASALHVKAWFLSQGELLPG